ncbi:hypothetical protein LTR74_018638 [Friedmanniomyces endolithicus]|nr:hypothetical protein LTR74_018638 [Friedmanniomyces endolithicus]
MKMDSDGMWRSRLRSGVSVPTQRENELQYRVGWLGYGPEADHWKFDHNLNKVWELMDDFDRFQGRPPIKRCPFTKDSDVESNQEDFRAFGLGVDKVP